MANKGYIQPWAKPVYCLGLRISSAEAEIEYHDLVSTFLYLMLTKLKMQGVLDTDTHIVVRITTPFTVTVSFVD